MIAESRGSTGYKRDRDLLGALRARRVITGELRLWTTCPDRPRRCCGFPMPSAALSPVPVPAIRRSPTPSGVR